MPPGTRFVDRPKPGRPGVIERTYLDGGQDVYGTELGRPSSRGRSGGRSGGRCGDVRARPLPRLRDRSPRSRCACRRPCAREPFSATDDQGNACGLNPSDVLRGDDPCVRRYPHMFRREGDTEALREYHATVLAEQAAESARQKAAEREQRQKEHERAMKLADKLEAEERRRREKGTQRDG
jgi:hypothetical protein